MYDLHGMGSGTSPLRQDISALYSRWLMAILLVAAMGPQVQGGLRPSLTVGPSFESEGITVAALPQVPTQIRAPEPRPDLNPTVGDPAIRSPSVPAPGWNRYSGKSCPFRAAHFSCQRAPRPASQGPPSAT